jgi:plastocyanin
MRAALVGVALMSLQVLPAALAARLEVSVQDAAGRPLPDAVVYLESAAARAAVKPVAGLEIAQAERRFQPSVTVVPVGSAVHFPNRDTVRHHVYSLSPIKSFEIKLYIGTPAQPVVFDKPGVAVLGCNIHDAMTAWTVIVETPWYGKSGADGKLVIDAAPGSYRLRAWHASLEVGAPAQDQAMALAAQGGMAAVRLRGATAP